MDAEGRVSYNCCAKVDLALVVSLCLILHDRQEATGAPGPEPEPEVKVRMLLLSYRVSCHCKGSP